MPRNLGGLTIVGTDGVAPVHEPDSVFKIWALKEIFIGYEGNNKYVPKLHDYVVDNDPKSPNFNRWYYVAGVDSTTMLSELLPLSPPPYYQPTNEIDKILGVNKKCYGETFRVYLDTSVMPHTLTVDSRFHVFGSMHQYAQIVRGSALTDKAEVVSMVYDQRGQLVDQNIPLELVQSDGMINHAVKCVPQCHTTVNMPDGELVTVIMYNDVGGVTQVHEMLIENTGAIRQTDTTVKYITDITLDTVFMADHDPSLLQYPINVPVRGLNLFGVVHYSDGSSKRLPVDGTRFSTLGLRDYVATSAGYKFDFNLRYTIGKDEIAIGVKGLGNIEQSLAGNRFMTKHYKGITVKADNAYSCKLFGYPVWVDDLVGYRIEWWLTNLERTFCLNVTNKVRFNANKVGFNGLLYGVNQRLSISINLKHANITNKDYIHTQVIDINLQRPGTEKIDTLWHVGSEVNQTPYFGTDAIGNGNFALVTNVNHNLKRVNIQLDEQLFKIWLERMYFRTRPTYSPEREAGPPEPNMFSIVTGNRETEFPITQWNQVLEINDVMDEHTVLFIKFFYRTPSTDLFLAVAGLPVKFN